MGWRLPRGFCGPMTRINKISAKAFTSERTSFTDYRSYGYAALTRWLTGETLNVGDSASWSGSFVYDGGAAAGPGVLTRNGAAGASSPSWSGGTDAFSRIKFETNSVLHQQA